MKKTILLFAVAIAFASCATDPKTTVQSSDAQAVQVDTVAQKFAVATANSSLRWEGYEGLAIGNPEHFGLVPVESGEVLVKEGAIVGGKFTFNMAGLSVQDIPADSPKNNKLRTHLTNEDFFDTGKFPQGVFEIVSVAKGNADSLNVTGNLTLKGITKSITFPVMAKVEAGSISVSSKKFYINRKEWGVVYRTEDSLGDEMIRPEVGIELAIVANK